MVRLFQNNCTDNQKVRKNRFLRLSVWMLLVVFCVFSQQSFAQSFDPLISFSVESCSLDVALEKLFAEYELNVAFSKAELSKIRIESYSCSYKSVDEVLTDLLKGTDYGFASSMSSARISNWNPSPKTRSPTFQSSRDRM